MIEPATQARITKIVAQMSVGESKLGVEGLRWVTWNVTGLYDVHFADGKVLRNVSQGEVLEKWWKLFAANYKMPSKEMLQKAAQHYAGSKK